MSDKEKLSDLIQKLNLKQSDFAKKINMSESTVTQIIRGNQKMTGRIQMNITKAFPNVNANWLLSGSGPMFKNDNNNNLGNIENIDEMETTIKTSPGVGHQDYSKNMESNPMVQAFTSKFAYDQMKEKYDDLKDDFKKVKTKLETAEDKIKELKEELQQVNQDKNSGLSGLLDDPDKLESIASIVSAIFNKPQQQSVQIEGITDSEKQQYMDFMRNYAIENDKDTLAKTLGIVIYLKQNPTVMENMIDQIQK